MGKDQAFAEFVTARWSALYRLSTLLVGDTEAGDVTQAALLKVYIAWNQVQSADSPDAYVRRIIVNTALSERKKTHRRLLHLDRWEPAANVDSVEAGVVARNEMWERLTRLPPRQRAVLVLRYYEDMSEAEIARTLNCAPGTVKAHAAAALRSLRQDQASALERDRSGGRHDR